MFTLSGALRKALQLHFLGAMMAVGLAGAAAAQSIDDDVRRGLVFLEAKVPGMPIGRGTGFFVSPDGYILTSYSLLEALGVAKPENLQIDVFLWGLKTAADTQAFVVDARPNLDLLLLKARKLQDDFKPLKIGSARRDLGGESSVRSSGFAYYESPRSAQHKKYPDQVTSDDGPGGYTWVLKESVAPEQRGSPVYTSKGIVVGMIKGNFGTQSVFVPIENAATLLLASKITADDYSSAEFKTAAQAQAKSFVENPANARLLAEGLRQYLRSTDGATVLSQEVDEFIKAHGDNIKTGLRDRVTEYMRTVVAYAYSAEFVWRSVVPPPQSLGTGPAGKPKGASAKQTDDQEFGAQSQVRSMAFYKTNEDRAELNCQFTFPEGSINKITLSVNNKGKIKQIEAPTPPDPTSSEKAQAQPVPFFHEFKANEEMAIPTSSSDPRNSPHHKLSFAIDAKYFKNAITGSCTIMIIGPAHHQTAIFR